MSEILQNINLLFPDLELKVDTEISSESGEQHNGSIGIRVKKQMVAGPHKGRCQRLERKASLKFEVIFHIVIAITPTI